MANPSEPFKAESSTTGAVLTEGTRTVTPGGDGDAYLERGEPFGQHRGRSVGYVGRSAEGIPFAELRRRCAGVFGQEPFAWDCGPDLVRSVGIVSGAAA